MCRAVLGATLWFTVALTQQIQQAWWEWKQSTAAEVLGLRETSGNTKLLPRAITVDDRTWRVLPSWKGLGLAAAQLGSIKGPGVWFIGSWHREKSFAHPELNDIGQHECSAS